MDDILDDLDETWDDLRFVQFWVALRIIES